MKIIRPITDDDRDSLLYMARTAGAGFTSLPPNADYLGAKVALSQQSFASEVTQAGHERYMFVLVDARTGEVGGCCAVEAACGLDEPFYNYHVGITVHASRPLQVYNRIPTLYLTNDYTGCSVMCSLYLRPEFRSGGAGRLLSKSRFMFMANHPHRFAERVIAEMRGVSDEVGRSPFWEGLGRHFFSIEYAQAEHLVGQGNKSLIAELMPPHPIYTVLLPQEARDVMGRVHPQTAPALHLLEAEGFRYEGYIDIFDGGPTVEAPLQDIHTVQRSKLLPVRIGVPIEGPRHLVSNTGLGDFRCTVLQLMPGRDSVILDAEAARALGLREDDPVRVVPMS